MFVTDIRYGDEFVRLRGDILKRDFPASALIGISQLAAPGYARQNEAGSSSSDVG